MDPAAQVAAAHDAARRSVDPVRDGVEVTLALPSWSTRVERCSGYLVRRRKKEDGDLVHGDEESDPGLRNPRLLVLVNSTDGCNL